MARRGLSGTPAVVVLAAVVFSSTWIQACGFNGLLRRVGMGFGTSTASATGARLLSALARPRFGGPVLAGDVDQATRDLVTGLVETLESDGISSDMDEACLCGGWVLRWSASPDVQQLKALPKPFVLGAVFQPIVATSGVGGGLEGDASLVNRTRDLLQARRAMIVERLGPERASRTYETTLLRRGGLGELGITYFDKNVCIVRSAGGENSAVDILERTSLPGGRLSDAEWKALC
uniref:Plastid lipid-associated protein/fibrillin conserved domain-containing protein n=1 Tax=Rhizochromulina marina TaxID=1034831 RepID=A0A7S2WGF9_9STRA|mmetsp:Transcript_23756/g.69574  ORF Transcript_23756/g.69574 Transcript_23756/m.69574 type:complete len:235 (+) Transcript_23756:23-727(+)